jgi:hypothetical protein
MNDETSNSVDWYAVRCLFRWNRPESYEERITLWQAENFDEAIAKAEVEGDRYAASASERSIKRLDLVQAYRVYDDLQEGAELFSLLRDSSLPPEEYAKTFFATGSEHQGDA